LAVERTRIKQAKPLRVKTWREIFSPHAAKLPHLRQKARSLPAWWRVKIAFFLELA